MATHRKDDPDVSDRRVSANDSAGVRLGSDHNKLAAASGSTPWHRRPRIIATLGVALVALIGGAVLFADREFGDSKSDSTAAKVSGPNRTLADYFAANNITQTPVRPGDPASPVVTIPTPPYWSDAGPDTPAGMYGEWLYDDAADPDDVPFVDILLSRLDGAADPAKVLEFAPGELTNLPDYRVVSAAAPSQLNGFEAVELGGLYTKNGEERIIAQKTVVIPSGDKLFVLQINANAPKDEAFVVQQVTAMIDKQAKITP